MYQGRIKKIFTNPERLLIWINYLVNKSRMSKVEKDGKMFYKYKGELYPEYLDKGNAASFIVKKAQQYCIGKGIDIGADKWPFPGSIPVQNEKDQNAYKLDKFDDGSLDYVFSSHCLEHLDDWQSALKLWVRKLKPNGILFLYLPHESMSLWHPGSPWVGPGHKWIPTIEILTEFLTYNGIEIIEYNNQRDGYWSFHLVGKKS